MKTYEYVYPTTRNDPFSLNPKTSLGNKTLFYTATQKASGNIRYFSGIDAEIYFGNSDTFIDEIVSFQFVLQENALPLFGYNSYTYDDIAVGSRIIQGQFSINFTKAGYMYDLIDTMKKTKSSTDTETRRRSPIWNHRFDIISSYGDAVSNNSPGSTLLKIVGVQLTGVSQQFDYEGRPILETYTFIAKDIDFVPATSSTSSNPTKDETVTELIKISSVNYTKLVSSAAWRNYEQNGSYSNANIEVTLEPKSNVIITGANIEIAAGYGFTYTPVLVSDNKIQYSVEQSDIQTISKYLAETNDATVPLNIMFSYRYKDKTSSERPFILKAKAIVNQKYV